MPTKERDYRAALVEYIRAEAQPPDKFSHQARLYELARTMAGRKRFDDDVLFAAAWIHDLGVFIGHRPANSKALARWDNLRYVLKKAPAILRKTGFPAAKVPAVLNAIRTHMPDAVPNSFEGTLLHDADILEQLGAIGILRTVSKVGRDTRFIRFSDAIRVLQRNADELPGKLKLSSAKRAAAGRLKILRAFLKAATAEAGGIEF